MSGLLRICTAGSVDDGKSTLIGRLLYDSRVGLRGSDQLGREGVEEPQRRADRLLAVHRRPEGRARTGHHDRRRLPLLRDRAAQVHPRRHARPRAVHAQHGDRRLDGRRRDPAGRRAATASACSRGGTRSIARLLGITDFVLAINKMDLVDFDRGVFDGICDDFEELLRGRQAAPDSAQRAARRQRHHPERADAVVRGTEPARVSSRRSRSIATSTAKPFRFPGAARAPPDRRFPRLRRADRRRAPSAPAMRSRVWPSGRTTRVKRIVTWDGDLEVAYAPMSVTLTLDDEIDISRGDMLAVGRRSRSGSGSRPRSSGWTSGRSIRRASTC